MEPELEFRPPKVRVPYLLLSLFYYLVVVVPLGGVELPKKW